MVYLPENPTIFIIDDDESILMILKEYLQQREFSHGRKYRIETCSNGVDALRIANQREFDMVLLDIIMPNDDGFDILANLRELTPYKFIPIVMLTASENIEHRIRCYELGADDFLQKPLDFIELEIRIKSLLRIKFQNDALKARALELEQKEQSIKKINIDLKEANLASIYMLSIACEARDGDTGDHILRIKWLSEALAREIGMSEKEIDEIGYSSMTHDVGKVKIPDAILQKPGKLDSEEWKIMQKHTVYGWELLSQKEFFITARAIAKSHHEKWDGSGYPEGLSGENIPLPARIVSVVDVFDALMHKRVYKEAWGLEETIANINSLWGSQFDPNLQEPFQRLYERGTLTEIINNFDKYKEKLGLT